LGAAGIGFTPPEVSDTGRRVFCGHPLGSDPHGVTLRFRGFGPAGVSPYWLDDPDSYFPRMINAVVYLSVFRPTDPSFGRSLTTPLVRLRPLQGTTHLARRSAALHRAGPLAGNSRGVLCPSDA
jgi:hypothetical protein